MLNACPSSFVPAPENRMQLIEWLYHIAVLPSAMFVGDESQTEFGVHTFCRSAPTIPFFKQQCHHLFFVLCFPQLGRPPIHRTSAGQDIKEKHLSVFWRKGVFL